MVFSYCIYIKLVDVQSKIFRESLIKFLVLVRDICPPRINTFFRMEANEMMNLDKYISMPVYSIKAQYNLSVNEPVEDFKSICCSIVETDISIQNLDDIINRLKYIHDNYFPNYEIKKVITELETLKTKLTQNKTNSTGESFPTETKLLNLIKGNSNNPQKVEG